MSHNVKSYVMFTHDRPGTSRVCNHQAVLCDETETATILTCDSCGMVDEVSKE